MAGGTEPMPKSHSADEGVCRGDGPEARMRTYGAASVIDGERGVERVGCVGSIKLPRFLVLPPYVYGSCARPCLQLHTSWSSLDANDACALTHMVAWSYRRGRGSSVGAIWERSACGSQPRSQCGGGVADLRCTVSRRHCDASKRSTCVRAAHLRTQTA